MLSKLFFRLLVVLALLAVMTLVLLDTFRLPTADIDLTVKTSVVHLRLAEEDAQLPPFDAARIQLLGDGTIEDLPGSNSFSGSIEFSLVEKIGGLSLSRVVLPARSGLSLRRLEGLDRGYEFSIERPNDEEFAVELIAQRDLVVVSGGKATTVQAASPVAFRVVFKGRTATLRFALSEPSWSTMYPVSVVGLDLIDVLPTGKPAQFSGIFEGSVHFPASQTISGEPSGISLRRGQLLTFGALENASLSYLALDGSTIELGVAGSTKALETRWRSGVRNHMPTYMGWLASMDWLRAAGALVLALIGGGVLAQPAGGSLRQERSMSDPELHRNRHSAPQPGEVDHSQRSLRAHAASTAMPHSEPQYEVPSSPILPPRRRS